MRSIKLAGILALACFVTVAAAGPSGRWVHVVVDERQNGGESVKLHLPLAMVEQVLRAQGEEALGDSPLRVGNLDLQGPGLRQAWEELRRAEDGNFLTVNGGDGHVRVGKSKGLFLVQVDEAGDDGPRVEIKLPVAAIDALFSGAPGELDIAAALRALDASGVGDIVSVTDGSESIRIWIDSRQGE